MVGVIPYGRDFAVPLPPTYGIDAHAEGLCSLSNGKRVRQEAGNLSHMQYRGRKSHPGGAERPADRLEHDSGADWARVRRVEALTWPADGQNTTLRRPPSHRAQGGWTSCIGGVLASGASARLGHLRDDDSVFHTN